MDNAGFQLSAQVEGKQHTQDGTSDRRVPAHYSQERMLRQVSWRGPGEGALRELGEESGFSEKPDFFCWSQREFYVNILRLLCTAHWRIIANKCVLLEFPRDSTFVEDDAR